MTAEAITAIKTIGENLPQWLAVASLAAPALGAVIIKLSGSIKALNQKTDNTGYSYPDGISNSEIAISADGHEVMVPTGADGIITLNDGRVIEVHDYKKPSKDLRTKYRNYWGNAIVKIGKINVNLHRQRIEEWITDNITGTYHKT